MSYGPIWYEFEVISKSEVKLFWCQPGLYVGQKLPNREHLLTVVASMFVTNDEGPDRVFIRNEEQNYLAETSAIVRAMEIALAIDASQEGDSQGGNSLLGGGSRTCYSKEAYYKSGKYKIGYIERPEWTERLYKESE